MPDQNAGVAGSSGKAGGIAAEPGRNAAAVGAAPRAPQGGNGGGGTAKPVESRWRLRNWRLRTKVVAVLIVPTITSLVLGGLRVKEDLDRAAEFRQTVSQVELASNVTAVVQELQKERTLTVARIAASRTGSRAELDAQMGRVDREINALSAAADKVQTGDSATTERYNRGLQRLTSLQALRTAADNSEFPDVAVYSAYGSMLESLVQLGREVSTSVTDRDLLRRATTIQALSEAKEFLSEENAALQIAAAKASFPTGMLEQTRAAEASFGAAVSGFLANATATERQYYSDTFSGPEVDDRERIKATAFNRADTGRSLEINTGQLTEDGTAAVNRLRTVESALLDALRSRAETLASSATSDALWGAGGVLAALVLALALMLVVTRSLLKPLRVLRTNALDVAYTRLPETVQRILASPDPIGASRNAVEAVPVFTREETGEVARSFDAVHEQAVRMAAEQALLRDNVNSIFVNLSRRSQALVERQLNLIDRLEQDEQDPDQLASLFELDHLATRMRRNSESLLVLSGTGLTRQLTRPVPAADVVGAAVSEVEQYARVEVLSAPDLAVQGRAVNDLVHLIAELLDNATSFSEPEKKVTVRMTATRKKELAIQITDFGVGMTPAEIDAANQRLADPPDMDVSVTRRMGLYVVARLAQRHDIQVRLRDNEDIEGGLIARIIVPSTLVTSVRGGQTATLGGAPSSTSLPPMPPMTSTQSDAGRTPARSGGIAGAFTGSMPRLRGDGSTTDSGTGSFPSFPPLSGDTPPPVSNGAGPQTGPQTGRWTPADMPPPQQPSVEDSAAVSLFGDPFAEQPLPDTNGSGANGTGYEAPPALAPGREVGGSAESGSIEGAASRKSQEGGSHNVDAPTERLPIYEAVLSQWFEAGNSDYQSPVAESAASAQGESEEETEATETAEATGVMTPVTAKPSQVRPDSVTPETPTAQPSPEASKTEARDAQAPLRESGPAKRRSEWQSPGDDGWQAAQTLLNSTPEATTTAGLPKRTPKAQLIPGSASSRPESTQQQTQRAPLPPRSADAVRGRMSSFQQGVRRGRHALIDAYAGDQSNPVDSRQNEEQE